MFYGINKVIHFPRPRKRHQGNALLTNLVHHLPEILGQPAVRQFAEGDPAQLPEYRVARISLAAHEYVQRLFHGGLAAQHSPVRQSQVGVEFAVPRRVARRDATYLRQATPSSHVVIHDPPPWLGDGHITHHFFDLELQGCSQIGRQFGDRRIGKPEFGLPEDVALLHGVKLTQGQSLGLLHGFGSPGLKQRQVLNL